MRVAIHILGGLQQSTGKCSHGGVKDKSKIIIARGGIYKGRTDPLQAYHSRLHEDAAKAAVKATEHFLVDDGMFHSFEMLNINIRQLKTSRKEREKKQK